MHGQKKVCAACGYPGARKRSCKFFFEAGGWGEGGYREDAA